jgi:hypothetical protein
MNLFVVITLHKSIIQLWNLQGVHAYYCEVPCWSIQQTDVSRRTMQSKKSKFPQQRLIWCSSFDSWTLSCNCYFSSLRQPLGGQNSVIWQMLQPIFITQFITYNLISQWNLEKLAGMEPSFTWLLTNFPKKKRKSLKKIRNSTSFYKI